MQTVTVSITFTYNNTVFQLDYQSKVTDLKVVLDNIEAGLPEALDGDNDPIKSIRLDCVVSEGLG
ncbi:MAG TPA: hypothetical protein VFT87_05475 [Candidatus Saccharimonadales bacterium]|nr:hypothetical protein [Candidatus Saccharimonadales bacterium]